MKTFFQLGTLPQVGDLIMKEGGDGWGNPVVYIVTNIIGDTYHMSKSGYSMHIKHLQSYYSPLSQETQCHHSP